MKRYFALFLVAGLLIQPIAVLAADPIDAVFDDVASVSDDLREAIFILFLEGTIRGYEDHTFRPQGLITRREFIKLAVLPILFDEQELRADDDAARDLSEIERLARLNNLLPSELMLANLDLPVTREEAVRLIIAAFQVEYNDWEESDFTDIADEDLSAMVEALFEKSIIQGRGEHEFAPAGNLTRGEAAKIAYRASREFLAQEYTDAEDDTDEPHISAYEVRIMSVTPKSLTAGEDATLIFSVITRRGEPVTGLNFGDDLRTTVTRGQATIASQSELGNGVYVLRIETDTQAHAGPICINVIMLGSVDASDSTCEDEDDDTETETSSRQPLVRLVPDDLDVGEEATIIATPMSHKGNPVSGLTLIAQVVHGAGEITQQMVENPAGSGVYIGTFEAATIPSDVEIRVRVDDSPSGAYTTVSAHVGY